MRVEVVPFDEAESILVLRLEPEEQEVARGRRDAMTLAVLDDDRRHLANPEATEPKPDGPEETEKGADSE
jgi:hypothetical protein